MDKSGARYTVRAIISSVLVIGLIVGVVAYGNYVQNNNFSNNSTIGGEYNEKMELPEDAHSYKISISAGNSEIIPTTGTPYITVDSTHKLQVNTTFSNGTYDIRFNYLNNNILRWNRNFNLPVIKIYLPTDSKLDNMDISVSAGELYVTGLEIAKLNTTVSAGELVIRGCEVDELDSKVTAGDFDFYANKDIDRIDSKVTAGEMTLYLPRDISGFSLNYDVAAGDISNDSSFNLSNKFSSDGIGKSGNEIYRDGRCIIDLNVTAGDITLDDY